MIVGETIARQLEGRVSYKRALKMAIQTAMRMGAEGIKIKVGGRLGGAEIARNEEYKQGRTPLHTLRMDIDYASTYAMTVYGKIGIKVWICKGEVLGKRDLNPNFSSGSADRREGGRSEGFRGGDRGDRRGGGRDGGDRGGRREGAGGGDRRGGGGRR
jgi:small subunit ribosomal protein S3